MILPAVCHAVYIINASRIWQQIKQYPFIEIFLFPCNLDVWECTDVAKRNSSSVTLRIERVKEAVASTANPYHFRNINLNAVMIVSLTCWKRLLLHISPQAHLLLLFGDQRKTMWEGRLLAKLTNKRRKDTNHSIISNLLRQSSPQPLENGSSVKKIYQYVQQQKNHVSMHLFSKNWINVSIWSTEHLPLS